MSVYVVVPNTWSGDVFETIQLAQRDGGRGDDQEQYAYPHNPKGHEDALLPKSLFLLHVGLGAAVPESAGGYGWV